MSKKKAAEIASAQIRVKPSIRKKLRIEAAGRGITIADLVEALINKK